MKNALAIAAMASCIVPLCRAASPPPVPESLLACRKLEDDGERVRCYDAQIAKLIAPTVAPGPPPPHATATAPAPASPTPAHAAPTTPPPAAARFGAETLPPTAHPQTQHQESALLSTITALRKTASGTYAVSLANGQIWRQEESSQLAQFFHVGDEVRIERAALGSYHMSTSRTGSKNWVRVTRTQ